MKFKIEDIESAINYFKKNSYSTDVSFDVNKYDGVEKLLLKVYDSSNCLITVTIFPASTNTFPTVTKTERLAKK